MRWTGHVARIEKRRGRTEFWWENLGEGDLLQDLRVDGRIILKCIFEKWDGGWSALIWIKVGTGGMPS